MHYFLDCSADEIQAILENPGTKGLELMTGMVIANGIKKGDTGVLQWVIEYLIGAPPKAVAADADEKGASCAPLSVDEMRAMVQIARGEQK